MARPKKLGEKGSLTREKFVKQFETLCAIQCTEEEICAVLDVDDKSLTRFCKDEYNMSFSEIFKLKRQNGKASLRRTQWQMAEKNVTMAIWLGKQYLGQSEKIISENTNANGVLEDIASYLKENKDNE